MEVVAENSNAANSCVAERGFVLPIPPASVVQPRTADEVVEIVRAANASGTPLVPMSSGPSHFHGGTVPSVPGAALVDLRTMNRILRVDRRNRMAVIEPGVTWRQLQAQLAEDGMRVTMPLLPRANKSVIASLLEREPTLIPRYQYSLIEPLRNCGVVWGSGMLSYTGEAGGSSYSLEEQWAQGGRQLDPKGPAQTDFVRFVTGAQGSMGIVVWASVKCELVPAEHKLFSVSASELEDLVDLTYRLTRLRLGDETFIVNRARLAQMLSGDASAYPAWTLIVGIGGRALLAEDRVSVQEADFREVVGGFGLPVEDGLREVPHDAAVNLIHGFAGEPHWRLRCGGGCQDVFFLTTLNRTPEFVACMRNCAEAWQYPLADLGVYIQPQHQGVEYHCEFTLPHRTDDRETTRVRELHERASEELIARGAYFSRPYGTWATLVYNRDAQSTEALRKVKRIFDPNSIMNPGKLCF